MKMVTNLCSNLILCSDPTKEKKSVQVATRNIYVLEKTFGKKKTSKKDWTHRNPTKKIQELLNKKKVLDLPHFVLLVF